MNDVTIRHFEKPIGVRAPCGVRIGTKAKFTRLPSSVNCPKCLAALANASPDIGKEGIGNE